MSFQTDPINYEGSSRLQVRFQGFVPSLAQKMKQIPGAFWKPDYG